MERKKRLKRTFFAPFCKHPHFCLDFFKKQRLFVNLLIVSGLLFLRKLFWRGKCWKMLLKVPLSGSKSGTFTLQNFNFWLLKVALSQGQSAAFVLQNGTFGYFIDKLTEIRSRISVFRNVKIVIKTLHFNI